MAYTYLLDKRITKADFEDAICDFYEKITSDMPEMHLEKKIDPVEGGGLRWRYMHKINGRHIGTWQGGKGYIYYFDRHVNVKYPPVLDVF